MGRTPPFAAPGAFFYKQRTMRPLNLLDVLIVVTVVALLIYAGSQDFGRYAAHSGSAAATPTAAPAP